MDYNEWRQWWADIAPEYFTDKVWHFSRPDLINRLSIQPETRVLELGFGYGRELFNFCKLSNEVYGAELTDWACTHVRGELMERGIAKLPYLFEYDGINIPYTDYFDVIYSCFVVQHLSKAHARQLIASCLKAIKPGGNVLFEFFGDPVYHHAVDDVFSGIDGQGGMYNNAYIQEDARTAIEESGGRVRWYAPWKITGDWGNHWYCFTKE